MMICLRCPGREHIITKSSILSPSIHYDDFPVGKAFIGAHDAKILHSRHDPSGKLMGLFKVS